MSENEMNLDEPATRRDVRDLRSELKNDARDLRSELKNDMNELRAELRAELANHPTHAQLDASLHQVMLHVDSTVAQHATAVLEAIREQIRGLDDQYRDLPARVTKLEAAVFSPPPKRKRKAG